MGPRARRAVVGEGGRKRAACLRERAINDKRSGCANERAMSAELLSHINDRGMAYLLDAPWKEPSDREARLAQLEEAFVALAPIVRPLAVEVAYCWRDLEVGMPSVDRDRSVRVLAVESLPPGTVVEPTRASVSVERVERIEPGALRAWVAAPGGERPGEILDWLTVTTLAVAVRTADLVTEVRMADLERPIPAFAPGWFSAPVGVPGPGFYTRLLPILVELRTDNGFVSLEVLVHWALWFESGRPERAMLDHALATLCALGWTNREAA